MDATHRFHADAETLMWLELPMSTESRHCPRASKRELPLASFPCWEVQPLCTISSLFALMAELATRGPPQSNQGVFLSCQ